MVSTDTVNKPQERRYRLVTSLRVGPSDGTLFGGVRKHRTIAAGKTVELCNIQGPGRIVRLWLTVPLLGRRHVLTDLVVRMYWDGERAPSVELPLGDLFGASFGRPRRLVSDKLVIEGGAYLCRFEMPFNTAARIEIANDSKRPVRYLFYQVGYYEEPERSQPEATFHAQYRREFLGRDEPPFTILRATGRGWLAGVTLDMQNHDWWLRPPFQHMFLPLGFGLGLLEGWETIVVDGQEADSLVGTGAEDYFSGGFYFKGAPFCTPTHGCGHRSFFTGRVSAYRFHVDDPVGFTDTIEVSLDHGWKNCMAGSYRSTAFWYQLEPHHPFPALPQARARRPTRPLANPTQWAICMLILAALITGGALLLWRSMQPSGCQRQSHLVTSAHGHRLHDRQTMRAERTAWG